MNKHTRKWVYLFQKNLFFSAFGNLIKSAKILDGQFLM